MLVTALTSLSLYLRTRLWLFLSSADLILVLLPETVANREEVPASLLVELPHVCLLTRVLGIRFIDKMHQEEPKKKK